MTEETLFTCGRFSLVLTYQGIEARQYFETIAVFDCDALPEALRFVYKQRDKTTPKIEGLQNISRRKFTESMQYHKLAPELIWKGKKQTG